jgi:hypothetical protein
VILSWSGHGQIFIFATSLTGNRLTSSWWALIAVFSACLGGGEVAAALVDVLSPDEQEGVGDQKDEMEEAEGRTRRRRRTRRRTRRTRRTRRRRRRRHCRYYLPSPQALQKRRR